MKASQHEREKSVTRKVCCMIQENVSKTTWEGSIQQEACLLHRCAHPNVVPITILGLKRQPKGKGICDLPFEPSQIAYFGTPLADMSLQKNMG